MSPHFSSGTAAELDVQEKYEIESNNQISDLFSIEKSDSLFDVHEAKRKTSNLKYFSVVSFTIDFLIVLCSIFLMNYLKRGSFVLESQYITLSFLFISSWLLFSALFKKFNAQTYQSFKSGIIVISKSSASILYLVAVILILSGFYNFSRIQTIGTCVIFFLLEVLAFTIFFNIVGKGQFSLSIPHNKLIQNVGNFSLSILIADLIAFSASIFIVNYLKRKSFDLTIKYEEMLIYIYGLWFFIGLFTRKFENKNYQNVYYAFAPYFKSFILMFATMAIFVYSFHLFYLSRLQIFGSFVLLLFVEAISISLYYIYGLDAKKKGDINSVSEAKKIFNEEKLEILKKADLPKKKVKISVKSKLKNDYLQQDEHLFKFIEKHVDLNLIDQNDTKVLNTNTSYNVEVLENQSISLIINLHKVNDFRYINRYFLGVHKKIYNGGYFVGTAHTIKTHRKWFFEKFPAIISKVFYPIDFIFRRILPKLPGTKKLYFFITRGKNRIMSKAEILGRLYFCGFKVLAVTDINNRLYYIAKCVKNPSIDKNPSYGPLIKLKRVGYGGNTLFVRKFRTMHPYSEYLQDYIYENNNLKSNGKFNGDFRLTDWGKWFRKLWIDELPQIINFLQGEVSLVGVRALSQHYFNLYPKELQDLRIKFKPGLIPPYYADIPGSFDEIVESEKRYLNQKQTNRFTTDVRYFFKAFINIFFKRARSL